MPVFVIEKHALTLNDEKLFISFRSPVYASDYAIRLWRTGPNVEILFEFSDADVLALRDWLNEKFPLDNDALRRELSRGVPDMPRADFEPRSSFNSSASGGMTLEEHALRSLAISAKRIADKMGA